MNGISEVRKVLKFLNFGISDLNQNMLLNIEKNNTVVRIVSIPNTIKSISISYGQLYSYCSKKMAHVKQTP